MNEDSIKKLVGKNIRFYRKSLNLSQFALGEKIDMDQRQIAYIEGGKCFPSLSTLNKFIKVFNCELKDLFNFIEIPEEDLIKKHLLEKINSCSPKQLKLLYKLFHIIEEEEIN